MTEDQEVRDFSEEHSHGVLLLKWWWRGGSDNMGGTPIVNYSQFKKPDDACCRQLDWTFRTASDTIICRFTQYYCSSFTWNCTQKYLWFPPVPFILETFWCAWRILIFAPFPYSLFSVVLAGNSYILRLSENTGDCWEPFWPGYLPENILLNIEIAASEMNAATPSYLCFGWNSQVPWRYLLCLSGWESRK